MRKILLAVAFALFGTFAIANELETLDTGYEIKIDISSYGCTATVWYNGVKVREFVSYSDISSSDACAAAWAKAKRYIDFKQADTN